MALATRLPTFELRLDFVNANRKLHDRRGVEQLAVQHVLEVPANDATTNALLLQTSRVIQVQEVSGLQTVGQPIAAHPRFFAVDQAPGQLQLETWIEVLITQARLVSDRWLERDIATNSSGGLQYDCVCCPRSYKVNFWKYP
jgi:hypothetical protein